MKEIKVMMSHENKEMLMRTAQLKASGDDAALAPEMIRGFMSVNNDSASFVSAIERCMPDVVLLDLFIGSSDAVTLIASLRSDMGENVPKFVVICDFPSIRMERELYNAGASVVMTKPVRAEAICNVIGSMGDQSGMIPFLHRFGRKNVSVGGMEHEAGRAEELELLVTDIIHQIGIPAHIKGYQYVRYAIINTVVNPDIMNAVTKQLYPCVAKEFGTTSSRVERAIRHAIEVAWDRGDIDVLNSYFGYTIHNGRGKPTNSEFIAMIADRLRINMYSR